MSSCCKPTRIALVQMSMVEDVQANLEKACARVCEAADTQADVICLPELFTSQYFCQRQHPDIFDLAETIPGPSTKALCAVAKEKGVVILASLFEKRAPGLHHNTLVVIEADGSVAGLYRKMHIPDDPLFYEKYYFAPGDTGFRTFHTSKGHIACLVCWDQWYPEAARIAALQGANIIFYPTAIGWHPGEKAEYGDRQLSAWMTMQRSHAIANGVFVAAVNRCGVEKIVGDGLEFWGHSFVADPFGRVMVEAQQEETILYYDCDPVLQEETRRNWPFLRDRRIDAFSPILNRFIDTPDLSR